MIAPDSELDLRARDELIGQLRHSEYLPTGLEDDEEVQLLQLAAPVFDANSAVAASILVLGSTRPMRGVEVEALGRRVVQAANDATTMAREMRLGAPAAIYEKRAALLRPFLWSCRESNQAQKLC